jgi:hypothetical protein
MIEAYKIGVSLVLDQSKILGPLGEVFRAMEKVQGLQKNIQGGINQMAAGYQAAARAANDLAKAVERVRKSQSGIGGVGGGNSGFTGGIMVGGGNGVGGGSAPKYRPSVPMLMLGGPSPNYQGGTFAGGPGTGGGALATTGGGARGPLNVPWGALPPASQWSRGPRPTTSDAIVMGMGAGVVGYAGMSLVDKLFNAGLDIGAVKAGLLTQRFSPADVAEAERKAKDTQRSVTGSTVGGNLELVSMLMAMTQNVPAAISLMPEYSKLAVALNASGHGEQLSELTAAMTSAELRGILYHKDKSGKEVLDEGALSGFLKSNLAVNALTHGRIGPTQLLQFLKSSGISGGMLQDQSLFAD